MDTEEITDIASQEIAMSEKSSEETTHFNLRDAVVYSTILERKYEN